MAESVFEAVKQSVTVREAAQMYGIEVNRSGMACCPFHDDKNPSMKLNEEYFYCFGCGATGDVIDFTARLYNLSPKEAAEKLAQDFGLAYLIHASVDPKTVQYLAGHENSQITMDIYAKVKYNKPEQLLSVVNGAFSSRPLVAPPENMG